MFGVVICSKCGQARGIKLSVKESKCQRCGATYDVDLLKIYFITDKESELAEAVRSVAVRSKEKRCVTGIDAEIPTKERPTTKVDKKRLLTEEDVDEISLELMAKHGPFTLDEFEKVLRDRWPKEAGRIIRKVRTENSVSSIEDEPISGAEYEIRRTKREEKVIAALRALTESQDSFKKEELKQALNIATKDEMDELISKLLEKGIILELSTGIFRMV